jgi:hypothetical protein
MRESDKMPFKEEFKGNAFAKHLNKNQVANWSLVSKMQRGL